MKKLWLLAGLLIVGAVLIWMIVGRGRHPDTSSVARFAPYAEIAGDVTPSWSPNDREVIYCRASSQEEVKLYAIPANGGTPRLFLGDQPEGCLPAWSPTGGRVAFSSRRRGKFQLMTALGLARPINIWTASASGSDLRQVTSLRANLLDPAWSPDGKQIAFTAFPGPRIMTVSTSGGEAMVFTHGFSPAWSPDGRRMAYFSSASGQLSPPFGIFVQPARGGAAKHLTSLVIKSDIFFRPSLDWSPDGERLLTVHPENGQWEAAVINPTEDRIESTLPLPGNVVSPHWSHDGKRIAYGLTDTGHPSSLEVLTLASRQRTHLTPTSNYATAQLIRYKSAGDLEIPSWLYMPRNSDLATHPALVWLHGGKPGSAWTSNEFDPRIQYFVDQGFVVLVPNYRGSAGFGDELARFHRGDDIVPDIVAGVNYLKGLKSVDAAHIGVVGFSFGGYLTLRSITQQPELFAAAVDFYGLSDLVRFYQDSSSMRPILNELLGGTPEQNREAYQAASPINFVDRIKTPLLILHGTADDAAPYNQSVELVRALKRAHKNCEFISYRFAGHGFSGKDEIDANQQAMRFLLAHLKVSRS
jgi:dipeptidyl aminopeptidase/acylaminoacyl peptidase